MNIAEKLAFIKKVAKENFYVLLSKKCGKCCGLYYDDVEDEVYVNIFEGGNGSKFLPFNSDNGFTDLHVNLIYDDLKKDF